MKQKQKKISFKRHFRIYFKNNHPAYIVDEEGNMYIIFHRVTHSKTSGGRKNWEKKNPIKGDNRPMRIVKKQEKDSKARFSYFEIDLKDGVDVSYPEIRVMSDNKK